MKNGYLQHKSSTEKIFYFFLLCLLSKVLFSGLSLLLSKWIFKVDFYLLGSTSNLDANVIGVYKVAALLDQFGTFMAPAIIFSFLFAKTPLYYLNLNALKRNYLLIIPIAFVTMFISSYLLIKINRTIDFSFLSNDLLTHFSTNQEFLENIHHSFVGTSNSSLIVTIFIMAIVPAFCEEFVFRGILQHLFSKWLKNIHFGIIFSALVFAVLHFQFYNLLALLFIGILLGYIVALTKNLWPSILLHFVFNLSSVVTIYLEKKEIINHQNITQEMPLFIAITVLTICTFSLILIFRKHNSFRLTSTKYRE